MQHYLKLDIPDEKDVYFVGDIHANGKLWDITKKEFGITEKDVVISLGDIVDRGNQNSKLLFEFLFADNRYMVMGNHEAMMVDGLTQRDWYHCWFQNGGNKTLNELGKTGVEFFCQYLNNLPMIIEVNHRNTKVGVVHGSVPLQYTDWADFIVGTKALNGDTIDSCLWSRDTFDFCYKNNVYNAPRIANVDYVLSGHTAVKDPLIYGNRIWIDSQYETGDLTIATVQGGKMRYMRREKDAYSFDKYRGW